MSKSEKKLTVSVFIIRMISLSIACFLLLGLAVYTIRLDSVTSVLSKSGYLKGTGNLQLPADGRERRLFQQ